VTRHVHAAEGLAGAGELRGARLNAAPVAGAGLGIQIGHGPQFRFASGFGIIRIQSFVGLLSDMRAGANTSPW